MTTICWDGETVAADSQITGDFIYTVDDKKIFRVAGAIVGASGDSEQCLKFIEWYKDTSQEYPKKMNDLSAMVVTPKGAFEYGESAVPIPLAAPHAIGSGAKFAMGALLAGASAKQAVDIACRLCKYSRPPIRTMRLKNG